MQENSKNMSMTVVLLPFVGLCFLLHRQVTITKKIKMSSNNNGHLDEIINELKNGSILTKQKRNGEQSSRLFYLDEQENFVSYHQSEKILAQAHRCKC
jgi:hypothetical protein